jgi:hypothetical protein
VQDVEVISYTVTDLDFALDPAPAAVISGTVTDVNTGWPLYAQIAIDGVPYSIWSDPVTGFYSVSLPTGTSYDFTVSAWVAGYVDELRTVGPGRRWHRELRSDVTGGLYRPATSKLCLCGGLKPTTAGTRTPARRTMGGAIRLSGHGLQ